MRLFEIVHSFHAVFSSLALCGSTDFSLRRRDVFLGRLGNTRRVTIVRVFNDLIGKLLSTSCDGGSLLIPASGLIRRKHRLERGNWIGRRRAFESFHALVCFCFGAGTDGGVGETLER